MSEKKIEERCFICGKPIKPDEAVTVDGRAVHIHHRGVVDGADNIPLVIKELTAAGDPVKMRMAQHILKRHNKGAK